MNGSEVLTATAEVAIAFAGFTGLIAIFRRRSGAELSPDEALRMRNLVEASLGALFASFLPFLPHYAGASEPSTWAISSTALGLAGVATIARRIGPIWTHHRRQGKPSLAALLVYCGVPILTVALFLNAAGVLFDRSPAVYLAAVLWVLFGAGLSFLRIFSSLWAESSD